MRVSLRILFLFFVIFSILLGVFIGCIPKKDRKWTHIGEFAVGKDRHNAKLFHIFQSSPIKIPGEGFRIRISDNRSIVLEDVVPFRFGVDHFEYLQEKKVLRIYATPEDIDGYDYLLDEKIP